VIHEIRVRLNTLLMFMLEQSLTNSEEMVDIEIKIIRILGRQF
jgi:hypothetical protein